MHYDQKTRKLSEQKKQYERGLAAGLYGFPIDQYELSVHYKLGLRDGIQKALQH